MENSTLAINDFERVMAALFKPVDAGWPQFADSDFDTMSRLLTEVGKPQWSCRPRTYAVLRIIDGTDLFDAFTLEDEDANAHFHVLKILGRGAFGEVHHVRSKLSLEEYARKRVHRRRAFSKDRAAIKMFENELTNLKRLSHHHLVKFVGSYTDPKYIGFLMSPVADCDLKVLLERSPFPKDDRPLLQGFLGCLCSAVLYLHNSKCRHKDLKPARDWSGQSRSTTTGRSGAYTPGYADPEVVHEDPRNSSADIWSLGCVYMDMLTVLRGESLTFKDQFFAENGTGGANPRSNTEALELWLTRLNQEPDIEPVRWITQMLKRTPSELITAAGLMEQIYSYEDRYVYYNSCCNGEEESEDGTSYQGSILEDDVTAISHPPDSTEALIEINTANLPSSASRSGLDEESIQPPKNATSGATNIDNATARLLSENGFNIYADNFLVQHAFMWAAGNGHREIVRLLLENGCNTEAKDVDGRTALHRAAMMGYDSVVELLLDEGAKIDVKDNSGRTSIFESASFGRTAVLRLLLERGADIGAKDSRGWTVLHLAAKKGHEAVLRLLLEKGAKAQATSILGRTALHFAAKNGHKEVVRLLLDWGADVEAEGDSRWTALHLAAERGHEVLVHLLIEKGAKIQATTQLSQTALHLAAQNRREEVVRLLLERGAARQVRDSQRMTALQYAEEGGYESVVQLLNKKPFENF